MVNVVGLDLSLTRTGIALPDGTSRILRPAYGSANPEARYNWLRMAVLACCQDELGDDNRWHPPEQAADVVVIEDVFQGTKGDTALKLAGLHWIIRVALWENEIPYAVVGNSTLKRYATGKGGGPGTDKLAMITAARRRLGYDPDQPDDNEADALWLRALGRAAYRDPVVDMPRAQTDSCVKAVTWPRVRSAA